LLGLFFDPEDGGDMFLQNVDWLSTYYTTLNPRSQYSSAKRLFPRKNSAPWNQLTTSSSKLLRFHVAHSSSLLH
jgi:hypothetical protein